MENLEFKGFKNLKMKIKNFEILKNEKGGEGVCSADLKSFKIVGEPLSTKTQIQKETARQRKLAKQNHQTRRTGRKQEVSLRVLAEFQQRPIILGICSIYFKV